MKINNLTNKEVEQLQQLLNKLTGKEEEPKIETVEDMIDDIIECFNFDKVHTAMAALDWKWGGKDGGVSLPNVKELKDTARERLVNAAKARLGSYKSEHWEVPIISATGGFEAQAWCNEDKTKITYLRLKFIVAEWDSEIDE
jgi:hypothetical protein